MDFHSKQIHLDWIKNEAMLNASFWKRSLSHAFCRESLFSELLFAYEETHEPFTHACAWSAAKEIKKQAKTLI